MRRVQLFLVIGVIGSSVLGCGDGSDDTSRAQDYLHGKRPSDDSRTGPFGPGDHRHRFPGRKPCGGGTPGTGGAAGNAPSGGSSGTTGGGGSGGSIGGAGTGGDGSSAMPPLSSVTVTSSPDVAHRVTKTIGSLGGSIETEGADGTHYSLFVPPGALSADTALSIAPTSISGLAAIATSTRFAVEFSPSGLRFSEPAALTIKPPADALFRDSLTVSWESEAPGVEIGAFWRSSDRALHVRVPHFSGVATLEPPLLLANSLIALALQSLTAIRVDEQQIARDVMGLPTTRAAVVAGILALYDSHVGPAIARTEEGLDRLSLAATLLAEFRSLFVILEEIRDLPIFDGSPITLDVISNDADNNFRTRAIRFLDRYMRPGCSGPVERLADWVTIPATAMAILAELGYELPTDICLSARIETLQFPTILERAEQFVTGTVRGVVVAPASTPGSLLAPDGQAVFPQATVFQNLHAYGAKFVATGSTDLHETTGGDGVLSFQLDRGGDEAGRAPRVTVDVMASIGGFWADLQRVLADIDPFARTTLTVGPPNDTILTFNSPPVYSILEPDGTTSVCVYVLDAEANGLPNVTVDWSLDGPGNLASSSTLTRASSFGAEGVGLACVTYHHPGDLVFRDRTARITAAATHAGIRGEAQTTLTPRWASLAVEARPESRPNFAPATNGVVRSSGERVRLALTLTGPGATVDDPPRPIAAALVRVQIESGEGNLTVDANTTGRDLIVTSTDSGRAEITLDASTMTGEVMVRFSYPLIGPGLAATVNVGTAIQGRLAVGMGFACRVEADGHVQCWGDNYRGQLGNGATILFPMGEGPTTRSPTPVRVVGIQNAIAVSAGGYHACALLADGRIQCWGNGQFRALGSGDGFDASTPITVSGISTAIQVSAGHTYTCALLADGRIQCWGYGPYGQVGIPESTSTNVPITVEGIPRATAVSAGDWFTSALLADGRIFVWGGGRAGTNDFLRVYAPVAVAGIVNATAVSTGGSHACALLADGHIQCWGLNDSGQLGNGLVVPSPSLPLLAVPFPVLGIEGAMAVSTGGNHTCALLGDGRVRCWGSNVGGESTGDARDLNPLTPTDVRGLAASGSVSAGELRNTCAALFDGRIQCWGLNVWGQLGNGNTAPYPESFPPGTVIFP